jgi:hypothetical protein
MKTKIAERGFIAELHTARNGHKCHACGLPIEIGSHYYSVIKGGGGLGWLKFPDRAHIECLEGYLRRC